MDIIQKLDRGIFWLRLTAVFVFANLIWHLSGGRWLIVLLQAFILAVLAYVYRVNRRAKRNLIAARLKFHRYIVDNFNGCLSVEELKLMEVHEMWTVDRNPPDFPHSYVARKWVIGKTPEATCDVVTGETLEEVRAKLPAGLHCLNRCPEDQPLLVETWL